MGKSRKKDLENSAKHKTIIALSNETGRQPRGPNLPIDHLLASGSVSNDFALKESSERDRRTENQNTEKLSSQASGFQDRDY